MGIAVGAVVVGLLIRRSKRRNPILKGPDRATHQSAYMHTFTGYKAELDAGVGVKLNCRARAGLDAREEAEMDTGDH